MIQFALVVDLLEDENASVADLGEEQLAFLPIDEHRLAPGNVRSNGAKKHLLGIEVGDLAADIPQFHVTLPT